MPLVLSAGMKEVSPTSVERTSKTGGFSEQAYSSEGFATAGSLSFKASQVTKPIMVGLNSDPTTNANYTSIDYAIYLNWEFLSGETNRLSIYESGGAVVANAGTYSVSDVLKITYDGTNIQYWKNAELLRTVARAIGSPLHLDSSFYAETGVVEPGGKIDSIEFIGSRPLPGSRSLLGVGR